MVSGTTKTKIITTASKNTGTQKKSKRANEDPKVSRLKQNASSTGKMRLTHWFNLVRVCWTNHKVLFVRDRGRSKVRFFVDRFVNVKANKRISFHQEFCTEVWEEIGCIWKLENYDMPGKLHYRCHWRHSRHSEAKSNPQLWHYLTNYSFFTQSKISDLTPF